MTPSEALGPNPPPGIRCPRCNCARTYVRKSLKLPRGAVRRYRACEYCRYYFTTLEVPPREVKQGQRPLG